MDVKYWWPTMYRVCMIIVDLIMHVKEQEDWQFKVLQSLLQVFQRNHYETGTLFCGAN